MLVMNEKGVLSNARIAEWTAAAEKAYEDALSEKEKHSHMVRLGIEELLMRFRELYGEDEPCSIRCKKYRGILRFVISQKGEQINPLNIDNISLSYDILEKLDLRPRYSYRAKHGLNIVAIPVRLPAKKNKLLIQLAAAVLLAVLTGMLVPALPGGIGSQYIQPALSGFFSKMTVLFSAAATPLVFCAVINGITGLGDVVSFGKVGGRLLKRMMFTYCIAAMLMVIAGSAMGLASLRSGSAGKNVFTDMLTLVLDMIPNNVIEPFATDNDLQVIVMSIFIGVIMLELGEKVTRVSSFISEVGDVVNRMMIAICRLLPFFVYLGISDLILGDRLSNISKVTQIVILSLVCQIPVILITIIRTVWMTKIPFGKLFSAQLPSLLINLTTSSQVSALPESIKCCRDKFGIDSKMVDFGLPLGIVIYMPNGAIMLGSIAWVLAVMTNGPLDSGAVFKVAFVSMVVAIAAPPIPGSAFAVMPILFSACGTDMSLMPLAVIVASTIGYLLPAMNGFCLQDELLMTAWKSDMVDRETLSSMI